MRKLISRLLLCTGMMIAGVTLFSCTEEVITEQYVHVDTSTYTFQRNGADVLTIAIESSPEWSIENSEKWLKCTDRTATTATFTATANETGEERTAVIKIMAGEAVKEVTMSQLANDEKAAGTRFVRFSALSSTSPVVISPNGRFVAGYKYVIDQASWTYYYTPVVIDLKTGESTSHPTTTKYITVKAVSNDGNTITVTDHFSYYARLINDEYQELTLPTNDSFSYFGLDDTDAGGNIVCGFGNVWAGSSKDVPIVWENGAPRALETPDTNYYGGSDMEGFRVLGCSADGSVFYGTERYTVTPIYWDRNGKPMYIGKEYYEYEEGYVDMSDFGILQPVWTEIHSTFQMSHTDTYHMSPDGRYVAGFYQYGHIKEDMKASYYNYPACFNAETGESEVLFDLVNLIAVTVDNNGVLYLKEQNPSSSNNAINGFVYAPATSTKVTAAEWVKDKYGITVPENLMITRVASNGTLLGYITVDGTQVGCAVVVK